MQKTVFRSGALFGAWLVVAFTGACDREKSPELGEPGLFPEGQVGTINPTSNTDGAEIASACAATVTAPLSVSDLAGPLALTSSKVAVSGATWASAKRLSVAGPVVTLTRTSATPPWFAMGFFAQNGTGNLAPGGPANHALKKPLLLEIKAFTGNVEQAKIRFWTYQGLKAASGNLRFDEIGIPEGYGTSQTTENKAAYLGVAVPTLPFDSLRIEVLNPAALGGAPWTLVEPTISGAPANKTCWHADPNWRLITNPGEFDGEQTPLFTHLLRTESHATHKGHSVGRYWEFNVYNNPSSGPTSGSALDGSGATGNLTSPAIPLRDVVNMCDQLGQGDLLGMYHWSHFHFQGYHETDDRGYAESGVPFDPSVYCAEGAAPNPYTRFCAAYQCCRDVTPLDPTDTLEQTFVKLGHPVCGATCIQTMQVERDACLGAPAVPEGQAPTRDERLTYYSLNNGRTWRRINHMNNRYHNGYPGEWHYNHAHPFQDGDGMLGTDHTGFDWDQDGVEEVSSITNPSGGEPDRQFGSLVATPQGSTYAAPAMRFRFRFEEHGAEPCDTRGDGYCAGWRLDDFGLDYDEECEQDDTLYFDTLGDPHTLYAGDVTEQNVDAICTLLGVGIHGAEATSCDLPATWTLQCAEEMEATHQHDQYMYEVNVAPGCADPYASCTKQICVESHGGAPECYPYNRVCAPTGNGAEICCNETAPWVDDYCGSP